MAALGVGKDDTVALYLRNDMPLFEATFAADLLGAYPIPVNWHYTVDEARYIFDNSGAKVIVIHADLLARIGAAIPKGVNVLVAATPPEVAEAYGVTAAECVVSPRAVEWENWRDRQQPVPPRAGDAPATIIYTSGTTGHPKGVRRAPPTPAQAEVWLNMARRGFGFGEYRATPEKIVTVITGPLYHSAPNTYAMVSARIGANVILQPRFDAEELLQMIERHRVTHVHMVPVMFSRLLKLPAAAREKYDTSSLRWVVHGAAPCSPAMKREMIEWWGPVIHEYYASTETGIVTVASSEEWLAHPGTIGRPIPDADVRVIDKDGYDLKAGEVGEIICGLRGVADFTYHGDDTKRQRVGKAGLISLGDVGYFDPDGFLFLCDRAIDMVISGGVNIYPAEIEAALLRMPGVADCAVFGIPDEEYGESVCAAVQLQPDAALTSDEVKVFLRNHISGFKVPKRVDFLHDLPREDSGKIFKRKLREPFWAGLQRRI